MNVKLIIEKYEKYEKYENIRNENNYDESKVIFRELANNIIENYPVEEYDTESVSGSEIESDYEYITGTDYNYQSDNETDDDRPTFPTFPSNN